MNPNRLASSGKSGLIAFDFLAGMVLGSGPAAMAAVIYVKAGASGANTGAAWTDAFTDLQSALAAAQAGDEIWVAAGVYKPTSGTEQTVSFVMKANVGIYGGFAGNETARSQRDWESHTTTLSGDITGRIYANSNHVVVAISYELNDRNRGVLDGFTIANGQAGGDEFDPRGGGIAIYNCDPTVANCTFTQNRADGAKYIPPSTGWPPSGGYWEYFGEGGAMLIGGASPTLINCKFVDNYTIGWGGAILIIRESSPIISGCAFAKNASGSGAGIAVSAGLCTVADCAFTSNTADIGSGIYCWGDIIATGCVFTNNKANLAGGGMSVDGIPTTATVINCAFANNMAAYGGGLDVETGSAMPLKLANCTFTKNIATTGSQGWVGGGGSAMHIGSIGFPLTAATVINCLFWNDSEPHGGEINSVGVRFLNCNIQGSGGSGAQWLSDLGVDGGGNIDADPLFVDTEDPAGPDGVSRTADDGLRLLDSSPCINRGAAIPGVPVLDILGIPRAGQPDIGAYENPNPISYPNAARDWLLFR